MLHTVPLDRTGTQPRPRQAKAIVCSCLLFLLLLSLFFVFLCCSSLSSSDSLSSVSQCHIFHSYRSFWNIPVQVLHPGEEHLQTQTLPLHLLCHPPIHLLSRALSSLQLTQHVTGKGTFSMSVLMCLTLDSPRATRHSQGIMHLRFVTKSNTSLSHHFYLHESPPSADVRW